MYYLDQQESLLNKSFLTEIDVTPSSQDIHCNVQSGSLNGQSNRMHGDSVHLYHMWNRKMSLYDEMHDYLWTQAG